MEECYLPWECENERPYEKYVFVVVGLQASHIHVAWVATADCCEGRGSTIVHHLGRSRLLLPSWMRFCNGSHLSSSTGVFLVKVVDQKGDGGYLSVLRSLEGALSQIQNACRERGRRHEG